MVFSILMPFSPATVRVYTTGAKGTSKTSATKEEKSIIDFVLGGLTKQDQFYETDPILKKVDEKEGTTTGGNGRRKTISGGKNSVAVPQKKNGGSGFGGLFAKK